MISPGRAAVAAGARGNPGKAGGATARDVMGYDSLTQGEQADCRPQEDLLRDGVQVTQTSLL